jgi:serine kinase of HPr protein (carbohydrate metabolism regulator)
MLREAASGPVVDRHATKGAVGEATRTLLHASCVDLAGSGVVLLGPSGCGKSDLALRLIDSGARLVADDRVAIERRGDRLIARPPQAIAGLIEVRGLGIMRTDHCPSSLLGLVVALGGTPPPRLPERMTYQVLGVALPCLELDPRAPSACAKIRLALAAERVD